MEYFMKCISKTEVALIFRQYSTKADTACQIAKFIDRMILTIIENIIIKVNSPQNNYLKTLPLHHTQKLLFDCDSFSTFQYALRPSLDFKQEILSLGPTIEVIQPQSLREEIISTLKRTLENYE